MTKTTSQFMRKLRTKLTRLQDLDASHCGFDERILKAMDCRFEIERMVEDRLLWHENQVIRAGERV